jgi:hypothetical protein
MRFRVPLFLGIAIGYVLGTRAGRGRYEQIQRTFEAVRQSEPAQQLGAEVRGATAKAGHKIEEKTAAGVAKVTGKIKDKVGGGNGHPDNSQISGS